MDTTIKRIFKNSDSDVRSFSILIGNIDLAEPLHFKKNPQLEKKIEKNSNFSLTAVKKISVFAVH